MRTVLPIALCGYAMCLVPGCTHMVESRVVQAFAEDLKEHDAKRLMAGTSSDFENQAVRGDETFRALKLIDLPEGMPKVVNVKDIKDENDKKKVVAKKVVATIGKERRKVVFRLVREGKTGPWVVDDLFLSNEDYKDNKSIAARLAVLLSMQESLDAWKSGLRDRILAAATPEFAESLSLLTPDQLAQFSKKITGHMVGETRILPDEQIRDGSAELAISISEGEKSTGKLILKFLRDGQRWRLDDLALESRSTGEDIASARLVSAAMAASLRFQAAFRAGDKRTLQEVCGGRFFNGSLAGADLTQVRLPEAGPGLDGFDMKLEGARATFVVRAGNEELTIGLSQQPEERLHAAPRFLVDEVTIYDLTSSQDKRLSSLFTAQATVEAFCAALVTRDVAILQDNATHDFKQRVWNKVQKAHFDGLPMTRLAAAKPHFAQTQFKGSLTEILIEQGETPLAIVLREEGGRMLVDDVLSPASAWPASMKTAAEVLIPVLDFAAGLKNAQMHVVRGCSTADFSRFAWDNLDGLTEFEPRPDAFFAPALSSISHSEDRAEVVLGDRGVGARFHLVKERGQFRVDDVTLIAGPGDNQQIALKRAIRTQLAEGDQRAANDSTRDSFVQPASAVGP